MSGYLFKRGSNAFKSWSRRWFILSDNQLVYLTKKDEEVCTQSALLLYSDEHFIAAEGGP